MMHFRKYCIFFNEYSKANCLSSNCLSGTVILTPIEDVSQRGIRNDDFLGDLESNSSRKEQNSLDLDHTLSTLKFIGLGRTRRFGALMTLLRYLIDSHYY